MREDQKQQAFPDEGNYGISIRDYFAAKAMQGLFARGQYDGKINITAMAESSYKMADAMLKAREE